MVYVQFLILSSRQSYIENENATTEDDGTFCIDEASG